MREQKKIAKEEREAEEALEQAMARLARIRKQKRSLKDRGDKLFQRGILGLGDDERDESEAVSDVQSRGALDVLDWEAILGDPSSLPSGDTGLVTTGIF